VINSILLLRKKPESFVESMVISFTTFDKIQYGINLPFNEKVSEVTDRVV
jgi:hypothetical protein